MGKIWTEYLERGSVWPRMLCYTVDVKARERGGKKTRSYVSIWQTQWIIHAFLGAPWFNFNIPTPPPHGTIHNKKGLQIPPANPR
jgi:hypothetical protein